jgi:phosphoesterase RecJ-like protein
MKEFNDFGALLNSYDTIILSAHTNPDGDAVGSCIALAHALKAIGKNVAVFLEEYGDKYSFLNTGHFLYHTVEEIQQFANQLFVCLDCGDQLRLGEAIALFDKAQLTVNIDHHISNTHFAKHNYVFEKSSTCEIVYELIDTLNIPMTIDIAKALYTGIIYDTGGFKHSNTTSRTHEVVASLIKYDFSATEIYEKLFNERSYEATKLLARAIDQMELFFNKKIVYSYITEQDMKEFNADKTQVGAIVEQLKSIKGVACSIFIYENSTNECKISMRSDGTIDICSTAVKFGGGGHLKACGCTIHQNLETAKALILKDIESNINTNA